MTHSIKDQRDDLETAIIKALMLSKPAKAEKGIEKSKAGGLDRVILGMEMFCPKRAEYPQDAYTFDAASEERLYTDDIDQIVVSAWDAFLNGMEVMMLCENGTLKWTKAKPMPAPVGLSVVSNQPVRWFAVHYRQFNVDGFENYVRRPVAIHQDNSLPLLMPRGWRGFNPKADRDEMAQQISIMLSVYEDSVRSGSFLVSVEEAVRLRFPVSADGYLDFLRLRDGYKDTPTQRRNPVIHWCAKHMRASSKGKTEVAKHLRGRQEFVVGPMRLTIEPNDGIAITGGIA